MTEPTVTTQTGTFVGVDAIEAAFVALLALGRVADQRGGHQNEADSDDKLALGDALMEAHRLGGDIGALYRRYAERIRLAEDALLGAESVPVALGGWWMTTSAGVTLHLDWAHPAAEESWHTKAVESDVEELYVEANARVRVAHRLTGGRALLGPRGHVRPGDLADRTGAAICLARRRGVSMGEVENGLRGAVSDREAALMLEATREPVRQSEDRAAFWAWVRENVGDPE